MRKLFAAVAAGVLVACGGGGDGGGGPVGTALTIVSQTLGGTTTVTDAAGFVSPPAGLSCTVSGVPITASYALVVASTAAPTCTFLTNHQEKASSTSIALAIIRAGPSGVAPPAIGPGTYPVTSSPPLGATEFALAEVVRFGEFALQCNPDTELDIQSGSLVVTSNVNGSLRGTVDLQIAAASGSGTVTGTFVAVACGAQIETAAACNAASVSGISLSDLFTTSCVQ